MRTLLSRCGFSRPGGNPLRRGDRGVRFGSGLLVRVTGDIIAMSPPLIIESSHIDQVFGIFAEMLQELT